MAATTSQGRTFTIFMAGLTVASAGLAFASTGMGKLALVVGLAGLAVSLAGFFKIKSAEGKVPDGRQPTVLKLAGLMLALGGWAVVLVGINLSAGVAGRLTIALIGIAVSLFGVIGMLPFAANKNAIWKA
jgi:hypothetical protein